MFGLRTFLMLLLLLVARRTLGQLQGTSGGPRPPNFSDFFSSVNLLELEDDIVRTEKLLERLDVLQKLGETIESTSDMKENVAFVENAFKSAQDLKASETESIGKANVSPTIFSINTIATRRDALKKFLLEHPFKFIGLLFSDLDEPKSGSSNFDEQISTDLTTYLGLKLMFKFVLMIFGVNSNIGKFIVSVSDSMRTIDEVAKADDALPAPFEWMELEDPSSSLVTTKENEFGVVSEVEARVTKGIISLMAAVSENGPLPTPKEKLVIVLQDMKDITTVVKEFLWSLKHEVFPAELNYLNNVPKEIISSYGDRHQSVKKGAPSTKPDKNRQYPEFYEQLLLGRAPAAASKTLGGSENAEKFLPAPPVYKSLPKREVFDNPLTIINTKKSGYERFNLDLMHQLLGLNLNDPKLDDPYEKWNILKNLFYKVNLTKFQIHYYNYFVDESSVAGRIKHLKTLLELMEQNSFSVDQEALATTKKVITNLEKLLADIQGVRKAAIVQDPAGVENFGEVYYNAETFLNEIVEISRATKSSVKCKLLDSSSKEMLQQAFAPTL